MKADGVRSGHSRRWQISLASLIVLVTVVATVLMLFQPERPPPPIVPQTETERSVLRIAKQFVQTRSTDFAVPIAIDPRADGNTFAVTYWTPRRELAWLDHVWRFATLVTGCVKVVQGGGSVLSIPTNYEGFNRAAMRRLDGSGRRGRPWRTSWPSGGSGAEAVRFALIAAEPAVGFVVSQELFPFRVPAEWSAESHGDVRQVADTDAPMLAHDIGQGCLPGLHAIEEVPHVIDDCVELTGSWWASQVVVGIELEGLAGQGLLDQVLDWLPGDGAAVDEHASQFAFE